MARRGRPPGLSQAEELLAQLEMEEKDLAEKGLAEPKSGYKYYWACPSCGTSLELKMRVTQGKRKCPQCGHSITVDEIDRQQELHREAQLAQAREVLGRRKKQLEERLAAEIEIWAPAKRSNMIFFCVVSLLIFGAAVAFIYYTGEHKAPGVP